MAPTLTPSWRRRQADVNSAEMYVSVDLHLYTISIIMHFHELPGYNLNLTTVSLL